MSNLMGKHVHYRPDGSSKNHYSVLYGMMYRDKDVCRAVYEAVPNGRQPYSGARSIEHLSYAFNRYTGLRPSGYW